MLSSISPAARNGAQQHSQSLITGAALPTAIYAHDSLILRAVEFPRSVGMKTTRNLGDEGEEKSGTSAGRGVAYA